MTATTTLAGFLLARIAEDEASYGRGARRHKTAPEFARLCGHLMREAAAKRRVVEMASRQAAACPEDDWPDSGDLSAAPLADSGRWTLRTLALPYADHPDYRDEWRP